MSLRRHGVFLLLLIAMATTFGLVVGTDVVEAGGLGQQAPKPDNSSPNGAHAFYLRKHAKQGQQNNVRIVAYYPGGISGAQWDAEKLEIHPGGAAVLEDADKYVCKTVNVSSTVNNQYITVTIIDASKSNNRRIYTIKRDNVCNQYNSGVNTPGTNVGNQLFGRYTLPDKPAAKDSLTGKYKLLINIDYDSGVPLDVEGVGVRLTVAGSFSGLKIGPGGGTDESFPVLATWEQHLSNKSGSGNINVPFGVSGCGPVTGQVGIYDSDNNTFPTNVFFKIVNIDDAVNMPMRDLVLPQPGTESDPTRFVPKDGTSKFSGATIDLQPGKRYEMQVFGLSTENTVDLQLPEGTESYFGDTAADCDDEDKVDTYYVTVTPQAAGSGEYEIGEPIDFKQTANVSGFPGQISQWGYNERGVRNANNQGVTPTRNEFAGTDRGKDNDRSNAVIFRTLCKDNTYNNYPAPGCGKYKCLHSDNATVTNEDVCDGGMKYYWKCVSDFSPYYGDNTKDIVQQAKPGCDVHGYNCVGAGDSYIAYGWGDSGPSICRKWECRAPSTFATLNAAQKDDNCKIFKCAYGGSEFYKAKYNTSEEASAECEPRCSGGSGAKPKLYDINGSLNCYQDPSFDLSCTWDNQPGQPGGTAGLATATASAIGYCYGLPNWQITRTGPVIDGEVCAITTAAAGGWKGVEPGIGLNKAGDTAKRRANWIIQVALPAKACAKVGNKPYVKVFNGDVSSGSYLNYNGTSAACVPGAGTITTWNKESTTYIGSGTTDAAVAKSYISGFRTNNTNGSLTQKGLTFANTTGVEGYGGVYGGYFGSHTTGCSSGISEQITHATRVDPNRTSNWPASVFTDTRNPTGAKNAITGDKVIYHEGNLYINDDLKYNSGPVTKVTDLPRLKIIVNGNIFINRDVTQLDGTYVALSSGPDNQTGGNIYTCSAANSTDGFGPVDRDQRPTLCNKKLTINGALSARSVKFHRTFGSLRQAGNENPTNSNAAEVVNFGPSVWLPRRGISQEYKSVTSLPPIL